MNDSAKQQRHGGQQPPESEAERSILRAASAHSLVRIRGVHGETKVYEPKSSIAYSSEIAVAATPHHSGM